VDIINKKNKNKYAQTNQTLKNISEQNQEDMWRRLISYTTTIILDLHPVINFTQFF
jgi:adenylate kinase